MVEHEAAPVDKEALRREFSRRLHQALRAKGWRQADLHRAADLPKDSISKYYRGMVLPTDYSLEKIARALEVKPSWLLPNAEETEGLPWVEAEAQLPDNPVIEMRALPWDQNLSRLRINRIVPTETAVEVVRLVSRDAVKYGKRDADGE